MHLLLILTYNCHLEYKDVFQHNKPLNRKQNIAQCANINLMYHIINELYHVSQYLARPLKCKIGERMSYTVHDIIFVYYLL